MGVIIRVKVEQSGEELAFHFPNGLEDFVRNTVAGQDRVVPALFAGSIVETSEEYLRMEWAMTWTAAEECRVLSYCNTIPTTLGGVHEAACARCSVRAMREYADAKHLLPKGVVLAIEDMLDGLFAVLSIFLSNPQFFGQTKEKLSNVGVARRVEGILKDHLDHWLYGHPEQATALLMTMVDRAQQRINRKKVVAPVGRKTATSRLTLPGKLTDCISSDAKSAELFIVEGNCPAESAKQARNRQNQAILPLRGKILNVEQANLEKFEKNTEVQNLVTAIGTGCGSLFDLRKLRYGRVIIMTDADVDGAHIASLLLTFFYRFMPELIRHQHLFLAQPPLFRVTVGSDSRYALDEAEKIFMIEKIKQKRSQAKVEISRFKGLGEIDPHQLRDTTMNPATRRLLRVFVDDLQQTNDSFDRLMGKHSASRYAFIQEKAPFAQNHLDI